MEKYILEAYFRFKTNKSTMDGTMDHLLEMYRNGQVSVSKIVCNLAKLLHFLNHSV